MELTQQHIIAAFKRGEEKATKLLFDSFFKPLCFFGEQILADRHAAEDIATESFLKLLDRRADFAGMAEMRSFLFVVAKNACIDFLRKNRHSIPAGNQLGPISQWDEHSVDREILVAKVLQIIYAEIEILPKQCKRVFRSIFIEGKTTYTIAQEMEISPQTVLNQKSKALQMLRIRLANKGYDTEDLLLQCILLLGLTA